MNELMKRYEEETGKIMSHLLRVFQNPSGYSKGELFNVMTELYLYSLNLEAQLTWRPVTQKPAIETEEVLIRKEIGFNGKDIVIIQAIKMNTIGDWKQDVAKFGTAFWLPTPPAPEGE